MTPTLYPRPFELLASSYHFNRRRGLSSANDIYEQNATIARCFPLGHASMQSGMTPPASCKKKIDASLAAGHPGQQASTQGSREATVMRKKPRIAVRARLYSMLVPASVVYALHRWKRSVALGATPAHTMAAKNNFHALSD